MIHHSDFKPYLIKLWNDATISKSFGLWKFRFKIRSSNICADKTAPTRSQSRLNQFEFNRLEELASNRSITERIQNTPLFLGTSF